MHIKRFSNEVYWASSIISSFRKSQRSSPAKQISYFKLENKTENRKRKEKQDRKKGKEAHLAVDR
jgi:hypothetical protein